MRRNLILFILVFTVGFGSILYFNSLSNSSNKLYELKNYIKTCEDTSSQQCEEFIANFMKEQNLDIEEVASLINDANINNPNKGICHDTLHFIGESAYNNKLINIDKILPIFCDRALLHGLLSGAGKSDSSDDIKNIFLVNCPNINGISIQNCSHGYGHSLATNKLSFDKLYFECNKVLSRDSKIYQESLLTCLEGYIMQLEKFPEINGVILSTFPDYDFKVKDISSFCINSIKSITDDLSTNDWLGQFSSCKATLYRANISYKLIGSLKPVEREASNILDNCSEIEERYYMGFSCFRQVGFISYALAKKFNNYEPEFVTKLCDYSRYGEDKTNYLNCLYGYFLNWYLNNSKPNPDLYAESICNFRLESKDKCIETYNIVKNSL